MHHSVKGETYSSCCIKRALHPHMYRVLRLLRRRQCTGTSAERGEGGALFCLLLQLRRITPYAQYLTYFVQ